MTNIPNCPFTAEHMERTNGLNTLLGMAFYDNGLTQRVDLTGQLPGKAITVTSTDGKGFKLFVTILDHNGKKVAIKNLVKFMFDCMGFDPKRTYYTVNGLSSGNIANPTTGEVVVRPEDNAIELSVHNSYQLIMASDAPDGDVSDALDEDYSYEGYSDDGGNEEASYEISVAR